MKLAVFGYQVRTLCMRGMRYSRMDTYHFAIEADSHYRDGERARIILDRSEALRVRRDLNVYLRATAPKRKARA